MTLVEPSLWDVEYLAEQPAVRDTVVGPVSTRDVAEFCHRYHYTGLGNNVPRRYGLWHGQVLLGVVGYNLPTRTACASVFGEEHHGNVWHMGRLALADAALRNSESRLIAGSLHLMERDHPDVWAVLTYAATDVGHIGYVYQATNAIYTGTGGEVNFFRDARGMRRSTYLGGHRVTLDRAKDLGWTREASGPKHRYLYILGSRTQRRQRRALLKLPVLPYPKQAA